MATTTTTTHRHRADRSETRAYSSCVTPYRCNPAAHGHVTITDICRCGARRSTLINGRHEERGRWEQEED